MSIVRWSTALVLAGLAVLPVSGQTPEELFLRGNESYQQGRFADAVRAYREVERFGIEDPRLQYNLGNAEFKLGNLGRSILHFERAHRLAPTDADIRANLEFARSQTMDRVEAARVPIGLRWARNLQDRVGPDRQAWVALGLGWLIIGIAAWGLARPGRWNAAYGWSVAAVGLCFILTFGSWYTTAQRLDGQRLAVVLDESVDVLAGPGSNNATLFTVHEGLTVEIRGDAREEWVQVSLPNRLNGWLPLDAVGLVR